jgi:porphobilinogen synthase
MKFVFPAATFPNTRLRRVRQHAFSRELSAESTLSIQDLIYPVFVHDGEGKTPITSMPGQFRWSLPLLLEAVQEWTDLGIPALALFPVIDHSKKCPYGKEASNPEGLIPQTIQALKRQHPHLGIIADVALDPYTSHGQDGLINDDGDILNDETIEVLINQALTLAAAGAEIIAPSDMMDGRVGLLRKALEQSNFKNTQILAYSAKYASHFYGPFREAVGSKARLGKSNKATYQMDPRNHAEALREVAMDIQEGADYVMVKPGLPYLDVLFDVKKTFQMPTFSYQVSGEYAMLKAASMQGWIDERSCVLESLIAFKRAGADAILSYFAVEAAAWLKE